MSVGLAPEMKSGVSPGLLARAREAVARSREYFLQRQAEEGHWHFSMEANATMDAQYIFFNRILGRAMPQVEARLGEHLLATQGEDGGWPLFYGGAGHLSGSIEAYFALKLIGHDAEEEPMRRARAFILAGGGAAQAQVFTRFFLAYFGQFPWEGVPALPPEVMLLPERFRFSIYNMSSWARSTVVPLLILGQHRPAVSIPASTGIAELWVRAPQAADYAFPEAESIFSWKNFFVQADKVFRLLDRLPVSWRASGMERALHWVLERQDKNGGWAGIQPAMINSVLALRAMGCAAEHPAVVAGIQAIDDFLVERDGHLLFQPCVSPTWDTALVVRGLLDAGESPDSEVVRCAVRWLEDAQIRRKGDWAIKRPDLPAAGWAFEYANDFYPDVDDSAVILMSLDAAGRRDTETFRLGFDWTIGMQSKDGGYGAFDVDNDNHVFNELPFADMKAQIDPPTEDLAGRLLELMGQVGKGADEPRVRAARAFLRRTQKPDGSWWGRWGVNYIYGTWSVLLGLRAIGAPADQDMMARATAWLRSVQNEDGGFGETCASYADAGLSAQGTSTASQTAWALMGLVSGDGRTSRELEDAADYLCRMQEADGSWAEAEFTGTGFPNHFYLRYDGYRCIFPLMALARFVSLAEGGGGREEG
ncbi:MAG: squalene--hopene cyclase [Deltaproteobacteria bacterium]